MVLDVAISSSTKGLQELLLLKEWLLEQPHLPNIEDEEWLTTFLHSNKLNVKKTKSKLENYYSLRNKYPDVLKNRDPTAEELQRIRKAYNFSVSPRSRDGIRIFSFRMIDLSNFAYPHFTKRFFMIQDTLLLEQDRLSTHIIILDCHDLSFRHLPKLTSGAGTLMKIFNSAYMGRSQAIHILLDGQYFIDKIVWVMKKYIPKKYVDRIFVHTGTKNSLLENIDEDLLCSDYGGKGPSLAEIDEYTEQLLEKYRPWFESQENVCSNELLRKKDEDQKKSFMGYFKRHETVQPVM